VVWREDMSDARMRVSGSDRLQSIDCLISLACSW
jgi:hypothetical protein